MPDLIESTSGVIENNVYTPNAQSIEIAPIALEIAENWHGSKPCFGLSRVLAIEKAENMTFSKNDLKKAFEQLKPIKIVFCPQFDPECRAKGAEPFIQEAPAGR